MSDGRNVGWQNKAAVRHARERSNRSLDVRSVLDRSRYQFDAERSRASLARTHEIIEDGTFGVAHQSNTVKIWRDLLEHRYQLAEDAYLVVEHTSEIAARPRQTENKTCADWVGNVDEYDRDRAGFPEHGAGDLSGMREQHVRLHGNKLFREALRVRSGRRETNFDPDIAAFRPSKLLKITSEFDKALFGFQIVICMAHEDGNEPDPVGLLRKRTDGPCCRSATNQFDEIAPSHAAISMRLRTTHGIGLSHHRKRGRAFETTISALGQKQSNPSGSFSTKASGDSHLIVRLSSPSRVGSTVGILGCTSSTLTPVSNGCSSTRQRRPRRVPSDAASLRKLERCPRLFGTNLREIGIAIVAIAVTMIIWFYASRLGFTLN